MIVVDRRRDLAHRVLHDRKAAIVINFRPLSQTFFSKLALAPDAGGGPGTPPAREHVPAVQEVRERLVRQFAIGRIGPENIRKGVHDIV